MLTRFFTFFILLLMWLGLMGWHSDSHAIFFLIVAPFASYYSAYFLKILPPQISFNPGAPLYFFWLIKEITKSSWAVIKIIWSQNLNLNSGFKWVESNQKNELGIVVYANSITLTPGTVTLEVKDNKLLVHALEASSFAELTEGAMDRRIAKIII